MSFLITIAVGPWPMQFFPSLLLKSDRILRSDGSFPSLNNFKKFHKLRFFTQPHNFSLLIKNVEKFNEFYKEIAVVRKREITLKS